MFGISLLEFFIIFLVLMLLVKPEDVPLVLRRVGEYYGKIQAFIRNARGYAGNEFRRITKVDLASEESPFERPTPHETVARRNARATAAADMASQPQVPDSEPLHDDKEAAPPAES